MIAVGSVNKMASAAASGRCVVVPPTTTLGRTALLVARSGKPDLWPKRLDELLRIRTLMDDWDGLGALAPSTALVDSAIILADQLLRAGIDPPSRVVAGVNGTVILEWQQDGVYTEIEVTEPYRAECVELAPGKSPVSWVIE